MDRREFLMAAGSMAALSCIPGLSRKSESEPKFKKRRLEQRFCVYEHGTGKILFLVEDFRPGITLHAGILENRQFLEIDLLDKPCVWVPSEWVSVPTKDRLCAYAEQHYLQIGSIFEEGKTYVGALQWWYDGKRESDTRFHNIRYFKFPAFQPNTLDLVADSTELLYSSLFKE